MDSVVIASRIFGGRLREAGILLTGEQAMAFDAGSSATTLGTAVEQALRRRLPADVIEHFARPDRDFLGREGSRLPPGDAIPAPLYRLEQ